ncbi:hypothetical protein OY671_008125, partial [Metschnikowia pulcherrima]
MPDSLETMLAVLANRTYRHSSLAQVIASVGTGLATVALGLSAYDLAGGNAGAVLEQPFLFRWLPITGLRPFPGPLLIASRPGRRPFLLAPFRAPFPFALPFCAGFG